MSRPRLPAALVTLLLCGATLAIVALTFGCSRPGGAPPATTSTAADASPTSGTPTLNLSRDLVRLGISHKDLSPNNPSLDARPLFQAAITYVRQNKIASVTVDPGNYYLLTPQTSVAYLELANLSDVTFDLTGSTIYFKGAFLQGLNIVEGQRVTLTNFQTDFIDPPYTHVELTSTDATGRRLLYKPLSPWRDPSAFNGVTTPFGKPELWALVFRDGSILPGTSRMEVKEPISGGVLELLPDSAPWAQAATLSTLRAGDVVAVTQRVGQQPIHVSGGDKITLSNVSVYGSSSWAVMFEDTSNSVVDRMRVMPRPGSGLVGSNGDGIHFFNVRQNNQIRNSYVNRTLDDAIVMDSIYIAKVVRQSSPRQLRVSRRTFKRFPNGTTVNLVDTATTRELSGAVIVSQDPPDSASPALNGEVELTLDRDLPTVAPGAGLAFGTAESRGAGSRIDGNVVANVPFGRGIWISGAQGITVQRNSVGSTSFGGIVVSQNQAVSYAAPPARDIVIQHNSVVGSLGPMASGAGSYFAVGAILVESQVAGGNYATVGSNSNITIRNNYVADSGRAGIWLGQLDGGTVQDNVVVRWNRYPNLPYNGVNPETRSQLVQDSAQAVASRIAVQATISNNTTELASSIAGAVSLDRTSASVSAAAAAAPGSIAVQANVAGFQWVAVSDSPWLVLGGANSGTGSGSVQFSAAANTTGASRVGTVVIGGVTFTVTQAAAQ